jgi:hypothetical protein
MNLARVEMHDLKITCSVFQCILKHTFLTPTAMVIAVSVQLRAELAVCCGNKLTNRLKLFGTITDCGEITTSSTCY